jgi:hypothetical protein
MACVATSTERLESLPGLFGCESVEDDLPVKGRGVSDQLRYNMRRILLLAVTVAATTPRAFVGHQRPDQHEMSASISSRVDRNGATVSQVRGSTSIATTLW